MYAANEKLQGRVALRECCQETAIPAVKGVSPCRQSSEPHLLRVNAQFLAFAGFDLCKQGSLVPVVPTNYDMSDVGIRQFPQAEVLSLHQSAKGVMLPRTSPHKVKIPCFDSGTRGTGL